MKEQIWPELRSGYAVLADGTKLEQDQYELSIENAEDGYRPRFLYLGKEETRIREIVVFRGAVPVTSSASFYGEAYNKLSQYYGTVGDFRAGNQYTDEKHYRLPQKEGMHTVYGLLLLSEAGRHLLYGFTSCRRFSGEIRFDTERLEIVLRTENLRIRPGECWDLETVYMAEGTDKNLLLAELAERIAKNHPMPVFTEIPDGWCSWTGYGPNISEEIVLENMAAIREKKLPLRFIQIDDGYQPYMGDWLQPGEKFKDMAALCGRIRSEGFEPAVWVAPFIAEAGSLLFREHREWFVKDETGEPLPSDRVSFGGWRCGPWYMLDGSNPGACGYLREVFRIMNREWKCRYFKLDANMWGALPFGVRHAQNMTAVESYRMGMKAVREGAGEESFLLGCNAPLWASAGTVNGMRVTNDFAFRWNTIRELAEFGFRREWMHQKLWMNDPDCLVLTDAAESVVGPDGVCTAAAQVSENEFTVHAAYILASGGCALYGGIIGQLTPEKEEIIRKVMANRGSAAVFRDDGFQIGLSPREKGTLLFLFNLEDEFKLVRVRLDGRKTLTDFWTDAGLGSFEGEYEKGMEPHTAEVLWMREASQNTSRDRYRVGLNQGSGMQEMN